MSTTTVRAAALVMTLLGCSAQPPAETWLLVVPAAEITGTPVRVTGTIEHSDLEGGFYLIRAADGTAYDPMNLPDEFRVAGLAIESDVILQPKAAGIRQVGPIVQVVRIRRAAR